MSNLFHTDFLYSNKREKAQYVVAKYGELFTGKVLDVGADECYLKEYLPDEVDYLGIGMGGNPDLQVDLECGELNFPDSIFNCVLCLDVLEHLDHLYLMFDELCRVSKQYVIIALPNCWTLFIQMLQLGEIESSSFSNVYGLPPERPADRHKWFFSNTNIKEFLLVNGLKNQMEILQIDEMKAPDQIRDIRKLLMPFAWKILFPKVDRDLFSSGKIWCVLEKNPAGVEGS